MRGTDFEQSAMFSYLSPEQRVAVDHPLRAIRQITDKILQRLSRVFARMYSRVGRPSIPPEKLLRALLLQVLYTIRSERMLMEQLNYNLLFRWFVGLNMDDEVWDVTVFTKNRERLLKAKVARRFFQRVVEEARGLNLMSDEHFTVDGTLLEACASLKSFKKVEGGEAPGGESGVDDPGNPTVDFHGEERRNETHQSTSDPEALLARKGGGKEAKLSYSGHHYCPVIEAGFSCNLRWPMNLAMKCTVFDLKLQACFDHLFRVLGEDSRHASGQNGLCATDGFDPDARISSLRQSLSGRLQGQYFFLLGPVSVHGLRPIDLSRKFAR